MSHVSLKLAAEIVVLGAALAACSPVVSASSPNDSIPEPAEGPARSATPVERSGQTDDTPPQGATAEFDTDFSRHTVDYSEILSGGPPKDGIPAIDDPTFVSVEQARDWLQPQEPVLVIELGEQARAYPIQILMWHEIVNDVIGDTPVSVTFCPLCNTGIAFEGRIDDQVLDFGTTGRLRFSNLIMYDRQTESWWQQATGEAVAGDFTGAILPMIPVRMLSWADFSAAYPEGLVLSRDTGYDRSYGRNPYVGYDDVNRSPFAYAGPETPGALPAMARVFTVEIDAQAVAYPYETLQALGAVNDDVGGLPLVVFWVPGTSSALDGAFVSTGRDVGSAAAYDRRVDGRELSFESEAGAIRDLETGSQWDALGVAREGPLKGTSLSPQTGINHFWFSWAAFRPETRIFQP